MMSLSSMQSGARARDRRKRPGLSGWRALTWPKESTTPSRARMRLAVTSSSLSRSSLVIVGSLQNKTHRAERAELVGIDQHPALLDAECVAMAAQEVTVGADIFPDALVAAEAVADEIG